MSHARKHIKGLHEDIVLKPDQKIARVKELRGSNICEIEYPNGEVSTSLTIRGGYLVVDPLSATEFEKSRKNTKITAILSTIIPEKELKYLQSQPSWPAEFRAKQPSEESEEEEYDPFLQGNPNRRNVVTDSEDDSEDYDEELSAEPDDD